MICKCGFHFEQASGVNSRAYRSFAVVDDRDYLKLIRAERRSLDAKGDTAKLRAVGAAAKYVTTMLECPACFRMTLVQTLPTESVISYQRESE